MICGVRASGSWFHSAPELVHRIGLAGVVYVEIPVMSADRSEHDAIFGAGDFDQAFRSFDESIKIEICPVSEVPLLKQNFEKLEPLLDLLASRGIRNVQYYAIASGESGLSGTEIIHAAMNVEELANRGIVRYVWLPAVLRTGELRTILLEGPRAAGDVSVHVDPDGSVYPPRGPRISGGNLISESWQTIWNRDAFSKYRNRVESPTHCSICPGLEICAADCPAEPKGWDA
jgi:radical SAM protein with 4Fe4S-binding SPASM domain